jgi:exopolysaccharide biosynthesis protein
MLMGSAAASHTYTKGKYSFTVTDNQYKQIQNVKKGKSDSIELYIKTKHKKTIKIQKYKNKQVTKTKWKYEYVKVWEHNYNRGTYKTYTVPSKYKSWTFVKNYSKNTGSSDIGYKVFKKKVKYKTTVKVKNGYKNINAPVYACVYPASVNGKTTVQVCFTVEYGNYFDYLTRGYNL